MNIIIFSKDRAAQLDLLLRSMSHNWLESYKLGINVLYTHSNEEYKKGYDKLINDTYKTLIDGYKNVNFVKENDFKKDLLSLIDKKDEFTVFFVDDQIVKEKFNTNCEEMRQFERNDKISCLSLRLHPNLTFCYAANHSMKTLDNCLFDWKNKEGDFGYPMSVDSHIF